MRGWEDIAASLGVTGDYPIGRYFAQFYTTDRPIGDWGDRWRRQGVVVGTSDGVFWCRLFSAWDGHLSDFTRALEREPLHEWRFFDTDVALRRFMFDEDARLGCYDGSEKHWEQCESIASDLQEMHA